MHRLLREARELDAEFVVWFVSRDYDLLIERLISLGVAVDPCYDIRRDNGHRAGDGHVRPASRIWDGWLSLPRRP